MLATFDPYSNSKVELLTIFLKTKTNPYLSIYYMASSASGQDERARWRYLALWSLSALSREKIVFFHIINPILTKLVRSWWQNIGLE